MSEKTWFDRVVHYLATALIYAFLFALITVPLGYAAVFGLLALLAVWVVFYLVARRRGRLPAYLNFQGGEFCIVVVLTVLLWYPLWHAAFMLYFLVVLAFQAIFG